MVMNKSCNMFFAKYGEHFMRIVVGIIFVLAGYSKLFGSGSIAGTSGFFDSLGIPLPTVLAVIVGIVEFVGGIFLLLGLWTRESATLLAIVMLIAILVVHITQGWATGLRYPLLLFSVLTFFMGNTPAQTIAGGLTGGKKKAAPAARKAAPKKKK